jgi:hypothetical protein
MHNSMLQLAQTLQITLKIYLMKPIQKHLEIII